MRHTKEWRKYDPDAHLQSLTVEVTPGDRVEIDADVLDELLRQAGWWFHLDLKWTAETMHITARRPSRLRRLAAAVALAALVAALVYLAATPRVASDTDTHEPKK